MIPANLNQPWPPLRPAISAACLWAVGYLVFCGALGHWQEALYALPCLAMVLFGASAIFLSGKAPSPAGRFLLLLAFGAAGACLLLLSFSVWLEAARMIRVDWAGALANPFPRTFIEGREPTKAFLMAHGQTIYPEFKDYPFIATLYGPVYHGLVALVLTFVEAAGTPVRAGLFVSMAGAVLLAVSFFGTARLSGARFFTAALATGALFTAPYLEYAHHTRPDMTAWGLSFAGLFFFLLAQRGRGVRSPWLYLSAVLAVAAYYAKQQSLPFPLGLTVFCLLKRDYRLAAAYALTAGGLAIAAMIALAAGPGDFLLHALRYPGLIAKDPDITKMSFLWERLSRLLAENGALIGVFAVSVAANIRARRLRLPDVLAVAHLPFLYVLLSTWGAEVNYCISFLAVCYLGAALFLSRLAARSMFGLTVAALCAALIVPARFDLSFLGETTVNASEAAARAEELRRTVAELPGFVIVDAEGAAMLLADPSLAPKLRLYDGTETLSFVKVGLWEPKDTVFGQDIIGRRAAAFIDSHVFIAPKIVSLLSYYYAPAESVSGYLFYRPRPEDVILTLDARTPGAKAEAEGRPDSPAGTRLAASVAESDNLKDWGSYLQPEDPSRPGVLTLALEAGRPLTELRLAWFPRLLPEGGKATLAVSEDGGPYRDVATFDAQKGSPGEGWDNRQEARLSPAGKALRLRFTLTGGAQLWLNGEHPFGFWADFADGDAPS